MNLPGARLFVSKQGLRSKRALLPGALDSLLHSPDTSLDPVAE